MIILNRNINQDNVQDWSDRTLQDSYSWIENNKPNSNKSELLADLIMNELNRRVRIKQVNDRFQQSKEFILKSYDRERKQI